MTSKNSINRKACKQCKAVKFLHEFNKNYDHKDGHNTQCKICRGKYQKKYFRTIIGLITRIYHAQKNSSIKRRHPLPNYTLPDLRDWAFKQPIFHKLHDEWVDSGFNIKLTPSFDRTDDYQGYSLDRLQIVTWKSNFDKSQSDRRNGINNKNSKAVIQMTKNGCFVSEYYSVNHASRMTGTHPGNISSCCLLGKCKTAGGFRWMHSLGAPIANNSTTPRESVLDIRGLI